MTSSSRLTQQRCAFAKPSPPRPHRLRRRREELIAAGDLADKLVLIASGEVEIFQCGWPSAIGAPWPGEDPSGVPLQDQLVRGSILRNDSGSRRFGAQPQRSGDRGSGAAGAVAATGGSAGPAAVASPSAVLLGSHSISEDPNDPFEPLEAAGVRVLDAATARPAVLQSLDSVDSALRARGAAHRPTSLDTCRVLAVRGAGECLGFPSLRPQDRKVWQASVRARGKVRPLPAPAGCFLRVFCRTAVAVTIAQSCHSGPLFFFQAPIAHCPFELACCSRNAAPPRRILQRLLIAPALSPPRRCAPSWLSPASC